MILILEERRGNYRAVVRLFRERYPDRQHPTHTVLGNCFQRGKDNLSDLGHNVVYWKWLMVLAVVAVNSNISVREISTHSIPCSYEY